MQLRSLLALALCLGLQTSLCTGGALATISGVSDFFAYQSLDNAPMSYGAIGYLSCENNSHGDNVGSVEAGCGDASDCLLQAFSYSHDQSFLSIYSFFEHIPLVIPTYASLAYVDVKTRIARNGPIYEQPRLLAHTLLKRE